MKPTKGLWLHLGLFGVAATVAMVSARTKDDPSEGRRVEAELWSGQPDQIEAIQLASDEQIVKLVPAKDAQGRYAIVEVTRLKSASEDTKGKLADAKDKPANAKPEEPKRFVSVDAVEALLPALAPAKSYRTLGKLETARLVDYGLDKPESNLLVKIAGVEHRLDVGALTPGSGDYYVRDPATGIVNTLAAETLNRLKYGESRLLERDLHGFKADDEQVVTVSSGGKSRVLKRVEGKSAWANPETPTVQDETAGNWLLKVQRIKPMNYVEKPGNLGTVLIRVDYSDAKSKLGYVELYRSTGSEQKYYAKSERSRWIVEVSKSVAEPIDQDLGSVLK